MKTACQTQCTFRTFSCNYIALVLLNDFSEWLMTAAVIFLKARWGFSVHSHDMKLVLEYNNK